MQWPFRLSNPVVLMLFLSVAAAAQQPAMTPATTPAAPDPQAQQVLAQARAAAGNAAAVQSLRSLEVDLVQHRMAPQMPGQEAPGQEAPGQEAPGQEALVTPEMDTPVTLQFQLPQAFRKTVQPPPPIGVSRSVQLTQTVNGNEFWVQGQGQGGRGDVFFFRRQGPEGPAGEAAPPAPPTGPRAFPGMPPFAGPAQRLQNEATRDLLILRLDSPATGKLQWRYVGTASEPNGSADVLDATGPNGFAARLYFDHQTHRLVMMRYPEAGGPARMFFRMRPEGFRMRDGRGPEPPMPPMGEGFLPGPGPEGPGPRAHGPEEMGPRFREMRRLRPQREVDLLFSGYRAENGVQMPHRIVVTDHGRPVEEWIVRAVKWNPTFPASTFERPSHAPAPK